jgi:hypothetical protein
MKDVSEVSNGHAFELALKGCEEGEQWHPKHSGRNKLIYIAAIGFLKTGASMDMALEQLSEVNNRCHPPLPRREIRQCARSAQRFLECKTR